MCIRDSTTVIPYIGAVAAWGKQGGLVQAIDDFIREGETGSCIDFGLHCTLTANVMEEADEAYRVLVLLEGKIKLDGTPEEVLTQDTELRKLNLDIPFATQLSRLLQDKGIDIPTFVDREPLKEAIWLLYSNTSATPTRL